MKNIPHDDLVLKINEFTQLTRERELTKEEEQERADYREEYLRRIRGSLRGSIQGYKYEKE
ncbi:MAG: DUF896 domain-containing protein [Clostridium sp.]|jgi:uncharacterized protein YnzC (UPF0291/DUF896 family)|nr:DUF896 domain-containing protein [Clostridium sp.]